MKVDELVGKYVAFHGYDRAKGRAATASEKVCWVPEPSVLGDEVDKGGASAAREVSSLCFPA